MSTYEQYPIEHHVKVTQGATVSKEFIWARRSAEGDTALPYDLTRYAFIYQVRASPEAARYFLQHTERKKIISSEHPHYGSFTYRIGAARASDLSPFRGIHDLYLVLKSNPNVVLHFFTGTFEVEQTAVRMFDEDFPLMNPAMPDFGKEFDVDKTSDLIIVNPEVGGEGPEVVTILRPSGVPVGTPEQPSGPDDGYETYFAYADDALGSNFSFSKKLATSQVIGFIRSNKLPGLIAQGDFEGTWVPIGTTIINPGGGGTDPVPDPDEENPEDIDPPIWNPDFSYEQGSEVMYVLPDGRVGYFQALSKTVPGVDPTDAEVWLVLRTSESPYAIEVLLPGTSLTVAPGASTVMNVQVKRVGGFPSDKPITVSMMVDKPGLRGTFVEASNDDETNTNNVYTENYTLTIAAEAGAQQGTRTITVQARSVEWTDEPENPYYKLNDTETALVTITTVAVETAPSGSAIFPMASEAYLLSEFIGDTGPNGLTLRRKGNVRPNSRGDGWYISKDVGSVLYTDPIPGRTLATGLEVLSIIPKPLDLAVPSTIMALSSTTRLYDYMSFYRTTSGLVIRTVTQNAGGTSGTVVDSTPMAINEKSTRLVVLVTDTTIGLFDIRNDTFLTAPKPAWVAGGGVRASWFGVIRSDDTVFASADGEVCGATLHPSALSAIVRDRNAESLVTTYNKRSAAEAEPEFDRSARFISKMLPGEETVDRTFFHNGWLKVGTTAGLGANGGLTTTGTGDSGYWTGWMDDVTWERDFNALVEVQDFLEGGLTQVAITAKGNSGVWGRIRPVGDGATFDWLDSDVQVNLPKIGARPTHLFRFDYAASTRQLTVSESYSGVSAPAVTVPAVTGAIALTGGMMVHGINGDNVTGVMSRYSKAFLLKAYVTNRRMSAAELTTNLSALGTQPAKTDPLTPVPPPVKLPTTPSDPSNFADPRRNDNFSTTGWPTILKNAYNRAKVEWQYAKGKPVKRGGTLFSGAPAWALTINHNCQGFARAGADTMTAACVMFRISKDKYWLYEIRDYCKQSRENYTRTFMYYNKEAKKEIPTNAFYYKDGKEYRTFRSQLSTLNTKANPQTSSAYLVPKEDFPAMGLFVQAIWYLYNNSDLDTSFMTEVNYWNKWADETEQKYLAVKDDPMPTQSVVHMLIHGTADYAHFTAKMIEKIPTARSGPKSTSKHYAAYRANPAKFYRDMRDKMIMYHNNDIIVEKTTLSDALGAYQPHIPLEKESNKTQARVAHMIGYWAITFGGLINLYLEGVPNIEEQLLKYYNASMAFNVMAPGKVYDSFLKKTRDYDLYKQASPRRAGRGTDNPGGGATWRVNGYYDEHYWDDKTRTIKSYGKPRNIYFQECGLGNDNGEVNGFDYNYEFSDNWLIAKSSAPGIILFPWEGGDPRNSKVGKRVFELYGDLARAASPYRNFSPAAWIFAALYRYRAAGGTL